MAENLKQSKHSVLVNIKGWKVSISSYMSRLTDDLDTESHGWIQRETEGPPPEKSQNYRVF